MGWVGGIRELSVPFTQFCSESKTALKNKVYLFKVFIIKRVEYSIRNGVAKELIHMTHGHKQLWGDLSEGVGGAGGRRQRGKIRTTVIA